MGGEKGNGVSARLQLRSAVYPQGRSGQGMAETVYECRRGTAVSAGVLPDPVRPPAYRRTGDGPLALSSCPVVLDRRHLLGLGLALVGLRLEPEAALAFLALLLLAF